MNTKRWTCGQYGGFYACARLGAYALVAGMLVGADCVQAQTWTGGVTRVWTQPDSDNFDPEYINNSTAKFTATGAGTVTIDAGGVTPGAVVVTNTTGDYTFTGGCIVGTGSLTKYGAARLILNSSNSFSGGIFINAGQLKLTGSSTSPYSLGDPANVLTFTGDSTFYAENFNPVYSGVVAVNEGVSAAFGGNADRLFNFNNALTGSGSVSISGTGGKVYCYFNSINNTFSGNISVGNGNDYQIFMNSLDDTPGRFLNLGYSSKPGTFSYGTGAVVPLVLSNRRIQMSGSGATFNNNATNANATVTINTDLGVTSGNKTFTLGGSNTGTNTFAGAITNGASSVISLAKGGNGKWILSGNNTFSGTTTVSAGTLVLAGSQCLSDTNVLSIASGKFVQLEAGVKEKVGILILGTVTNTTPKVWGAIGNSNAETNSASLLGTGLLYVNVDPPPLGTLMYLK